ncbi:MAG TPA: cation:proton antiporter [Thermoanaerobaculia bacterium]|nr:cation:proton antiporter [Thermoanaerobaculia bacterium]
MERARKDLVYAAVLMICGAGILLGGPGPLEHLGQPLARLLLQLIVIIAFARLFGALFRRLGQPAVVGEIVAGIALGPSVLGAAAPRLSEFLFEASSLTTLKLFAEIGVVLFLFVVGLELDLTRLRKMAHTAVVVSQASIVVPYGLGVVLSLFLYRELAPPGVTFLAFALFMGIAMSITAFPVLARILSERRLTGTHLGDTAITCAAVNDVTAWMILAVVVAAVGTGGFRPAAATVAWTLAFSIAMIRLVRPQLARLLARANGGALPGRTAMTGALVFLLASALATESIGIHALFGAFLAGAVIPREAGLREALTLRLEEMTSVLLLPLFFAFTGLRTDIGLLGDARGWLLCGVIVIVATAGKLGGTLFAARLTGLGWVDSFALGALMNTRGLMELIALNLGYELGILSSRAFAMLVLMALVTTLATGPLLSLADRLRAARK